MTVNGCDWNSSCCTPPATGGYYYDPNAGQQMYRSGPVKRVNGWVYSSDILTTEGFKTDKGYVSPSKYPGVLTNPLRQDGTALNRGYGLASASGFNGHIPVYTEGNNWPFVGLCNPTPPYCDFDGMYNSNYSILVQIIHRHKLNHPQPYHIHR